MTLGDIVSKYRKKHSVSLGAFARRAGLSKSYLFALEKNTNPTSGKPIKPTLETALACCRAMEMDIVTFINKVAPDYAEDLMPHVHATAGSASTTASRPKDSPPSPSTLYMPGIVPPHIPVNNDTVLEAYKERRLLILPTPLPRKGDLVYIPVREYMMPVTFTVTEAGGGMFSAYAEACGSCLFSIFDLHKTVFTKYGGARAIVSKWELEENLSGS